MWFRKKTNTPFGPIEFGDYLLKEVTKEDWQAFRSFYLRALKENPASSSESYEEKKEERPEQWATELEQSVQDSRSLICGVIHKPSREYVGVVRIKGNGESKLSHEAHVRSYYFLPEHQDPKLQQFVWQTVFKHFKQFTDVQKLKAAVLSSDRSAIVFFNTMGFMRYGYDESYFRIARKFVDAILMLKRL